MMYYSLNKKAANTSFSNAVIKGIAPDKGLYFPEKITPLPIEFWNNIDSFTNEEIAYLAIQQFVNEEIPESTLKTIIKETINFDFPVVNLDKSISVLELFHGPTLAFKDVGARFMARCLGYFNKDNSNKITVLVATSGDTGGAVANGFLNVKGVDVIILYPSGKVSKVQEKQLTTLGCNITALEVNGTFDDCQDMVKEAFLDKEITDKKQLTSANSINLARWLPQMFYFLFTFKALKKRYNSIVFVVPSGNFGNICAGLMAKQLGMPVPYFVAANNANNSVTNFLQTGKFKAQETVATISNAMDVGNPSNFIRINEIYKSDYSIIKSNLKSYSFNDDETKNALKLIYKKHNYIADPHGAIGYLGAQAFLKEFPNNHCVFLETAHPAKFLDTVEETIGQSIKVPDSITKLMDKEKKSILISNYNDLKNILLSNI